MFLTVEKKGKTNFDNFNWEKNSFDWVISPVLQEMLQYGVHLERALSTVLADHSKEEQYMADVPQGFILKPGLHCQV